MQWIHPLGYERGNRLTETVNRSTQTYTYDDADKLLSITGGPNPRTYTYDLSGRTKTIVNTAGTTQFTYDYDGQATAISYPNASADSFGYNGLGARTSSSGVNGNKTFRRAGIGVLSSVMSDGTKQYTPGVSSRTGNASTFQHSGLKNALDQTDSSQTVTASRHYDAFGNVINSFGTWEGPFGYGGQFGYQEDGNGLKLLGHRYYDSDTGRFLTSDTIGSGRNWYTYAGNDPISFADASGLAAIVLDGAGGRFWRAMGAIMDPDEYRNGYKRKNGLDRMDNCPSGKHKRHPSYQSCSRFVDYVMTPEDPDYPPTGTTWYQLPYLKNNEVHPEVSIEIPRDGYVMGSVANGGMEFMDILIKEGHTGFYLGEVVKDGTVEYMVMEASLGDHAPEIHVLSKAEFERKFKQWARIRRVRQ